MVLLMIPACLLAVLSAARGDVMAAVFAAGTALATAWTGILSGAIGEAAIAFRDLVRHTLSRP